MASFRSMDRFSEGGIEPSVEDLITDPVTEAIMKRDGVSVSSLRSLIEATRENLRVRETHF